MTNGRQKGKKKLKKGQNTAAFGNPSSSVHSCGGDTAVWGLQDVPMQCWGFAASPHPSHRHPAAAGNSVPTLLAAAVTNAKGVCLQVLTGL